MAVGHTMFSNMTIHRNNGVLGRQLLSVHQLNEKKLQALNTVLLSDPYFLVSFLGQTGPCQSSVTH